MQGLNLTITVVGTQQQWRQRREPSGWPSVRPSLTCPAAMCLSIHQLADMLTLFAGLVCIFLSADGPRTATAQNVTWCWGEHNCCMRNMRSLLGGMGWGWL